MQKGFRIKVQLSSNAASQSLTHYQQRASQGHRQWSPWGKKASGLESSEPWAQSLLSPGARALPARQGYQTKHITATASIQGLLQEPTGEAPQLTLSLPTHDQGTTAGPALLTSLRLILHKGFPSLPLLPGIHSLTLHLFHS